MAIIQGNAKQGSVRGFYPKVINGSLRFNDDDSAYLSWTPASAGNRKTWTWSGWVKRCNLGGIYWIFGGSNGSTTQGRIGFNSTTDKFIVFDWQNGDTMNVSTNAVLRDPSAWYHIVATVDTTQATSTDRVKIYINGVQQETTFTVTPTQNLDTSFNDAVSHSLGRDNYGSGGGYSDVYLANVHFIDGQALTASDFGETKNGVWVAKDYAGTFGTNGFYLTFEDDTQVEAFNTVLWRGDGTENKSITGFGFQPDLVWIKARSAAYSNTLFDAVRGGSNYLMTDSTAAEQPNWGVLDSFDSDGITVSSGTSGILHVNGSGETYVAWGWKAGDSNVSNTDGTITSTVRANDTYGFSIVSYTGNATNSTVGHGLSSAPDMVIVKNRGTAGTSWRVYHSSLTSASYYLMLDDTTGELSGTYWNNTAPTSSVFSLGTGSDVNQNGVGHIAYCWSETTGYSKFGSYTGNGSTDGPEVTTGFEPAMVILKNASNTSDWRIYDNTRDADKIGDKDLYPNSSSAEGSGSNAVQFNADGFKLIFAGGSGLNASGDTYIYAAFADTREAAFWLDQSGNDNDWQPVNLDHNDTVADSPTNNFATLNPLSVPSSPSRTFSDGNLRFDATTNNAKALGTILLPTSGQWYWEATQLGGTTTATIGVANANYNNETTGRIGYRNDGNKIDETNTVSSYGTTYQSGDVIGVAFDADADTLTFYKNGVSQGTAFTGMAARSDNGLVPFVQAYTTTPFEFNFGQQPFKYDPPA